MQLSTDVTNATPHTQHDRSDARMPAYDLYGPVHKGLRWSLASLITRLGTCPWNDPQSVQMALDDLEGVLYVCERHAAHEDRSVHVALEARRAGSTTSLGGAHERLETMIGELRALAAAFSSAPSSAQPGLWRTLYLRYAAFAGENLAHMSEEELVVQPLLEALYSLPELMQIHRELLSGIGPEEQAANMRVMVLGATPDERVTLLSRVKAVVPPPAFGALLNSLRGSLGAADFAALAARLE
jgi:hypothetical protein